MLARAKITAKKPESKTNNPVSYTKASNLSQSISLPIDHILHLQRTIGNQAVQRMFESNALQAKLRVGQPNDIYEQEADRVAEQVMRMPEPAIQPTWAAGGPSCREEEPVQTKALSEQITPFVQRQAEEEEEEIQTKALSGEITPLVQMQPEEDDEEEIQTKLSPSVQLLLQKQEDMEEEPVQTKSLSPEPPVVQKQEETEEEEEPVMTKGISGRTQQTRDDLHTRLSRNRGAGQPLPEADRSFMERRFGSDFSDVSVHTDSSAVQMNRELNAQAFTHGRDIYFGAGRYNPGTSSGKKLLAHELTHVVQQKRGHQNLQRYVTCELREDCSKRVRGEITRSRNNPMTVSSVSGPVRGLLVANFAVGSGSVKRDLSNNNIWANFWGQMLTNTNIRWEIIGFSDCGGDKGTNELLRWERAIAVNNALPQLARNQVDAFRAAPLSECIWSNADEQGRIYNRSVLIRQKSVTYEFPEETITVNPYAACYDATTVIVRKNGRMHSCPAVTGSIGSPTPNGLYCIRGQGVAQRTKWHRGRSKWYLIEPQFSTTRSRMHLHPGSISAGCVTVTNESCFDRLAAILNRPGTVTGVGYDGYPPGNTEGVTNPRRTITCVGWLLVNRSTGACSFMTASP